MFLSGCLGEPTANPHPLLLRSMREARSKNSVLPELAWVEAVSSALERVGCPDVDVGTPRISPPWTGGDEGEGDASHAQCSGTRSFRLVLSQCTPPPTYAVSPHPILPPQGGKGYQGGGFPIPIHRRKTRKSHFFSFVIDSDSHYLPA